MTDYILEGFRISLDKEEKKIVFFDKDKNPILTIDKLKDCILIGKLMVDFFTEIYFYEEVFK